MSLHADSLPVPLGLDRYVPAPETNPLTPGKAALGRELFFSKELSLDRTLACADCHAPEHAFTDQRPIARGIRDQLAGRRSPRLINRAWGRSFFWDGRAATLEQQVLGPIVNPKEMGMTLEGVVERLRAHRPLALRFQQEFQQPPSAATLAAALATYVRTILAGDSPYDRHVAGQPGALSAEAAAGLRLFRGKANCIACHVGANFTDESFHATGTAWRDGRLTDLGRAEHTGDPTDRGAFKTPGLRNVAQGAPYMHDGSLPTLSAVVDFYDEGGRAMPGLDPEMRRLHLTPAEKKALVAFLESLTGRVREGWTRP